MIWILGAWFVGFVLCVLFAAIRVYRDGKFCLNDIFEYLPVCMASWVTIICDCVQYFFKRDIIFWLRNDENNE